MKVCQTVGNLVTFDVAPTTKKFRRQAHIKHTILQIERNSGDNLNDKRPTKIALVDVATT